jgi:3-hydroxybutyryl-CoA dehydrogenase
MRILIAGAPLFVEELGRLCERAGHGWTPGTDRADGRGPAGPVDVVIDVHHAPDAKARFLADQAPRVPNALILTSALSVSTTQAGAWTGTPERVVGFGLVPPLEETGLVELAAGLLTSATALAQAAAFWQSLGYEPVRVADGPGLVRARILCCIINEAASALLEQIASPQDIDTAMRLGTNYPRGPLEWADQIGVDTVLHVMEGLFHEWGEERYRPNPLLRRMVQAGRLGRRVGQGFYVWEQEKQRLMREA